MAEFKYRKKRKDFKEQLKTNNDYREIALTKMGTRQLTLTLLSIFAVTMVSIGTTFAMFTVSSKSAEYNVVKTGTLTIDFSSSSSTIGLNNALPMSDSSGLAQTGNTFTIRNTGTLPANYTVSLRDDKDMITQDNCSDKQLDKSYIKYSIDNTTAKFLSDSTESLITGTLNAGASKTFTLKLWIKDYSPNTVLNKHYHGKIVVDAAQEVNTVRGTAEEMIASANPETLDYNTADISQKNQMWAFTHEATTQLGATTDYRYIGVNPNNYVKFNDELWRIIGVFDVDDGTGKIEKRMKIIRNESIGGYSWDYTSSGSYTNDWKTAQLNTLLNSGAYYNRTTGSYYNSSTSPSNVDFTSKGLTNTAKSMIGDAKWYLGGSSTEDGVTAPMFYTRERGTTVYSGRSTNWTGKVGLMYPSDYGYATSGGSSTNRTSCMEKELYKWRASSYSDCKNNDWLYNSSSPQWTMSPRADNSNYVFRVHSTGYVPSINAFVRDEAQPVVHLKSTIKVVSGSGTPDSPFILSGN